MANTFITKAVNARDFQTQIDNLNTKLDSVAKNLTYFDFYNIVDVNVNKNVFKFPGYSLPLPINGPNITTNKNKGSELF